MTSTGELLALMHSAPTHVRSLRGIARTWSDAAGYRRACEAEAGRAGHRHRTSDEAPTQQRHRLWIMGSRWFRLESDLPAIGDTQVLVANGADWWWYRPGRGVIADHDGRPIYFANNLRAELQVATHIGWFDYSVLGTTEHVGRPCLRVRARPRTLAGWDAPAPALLPGEEREMLVDQSTGVALRYENRIGGESFYCFEFEEVAFGEDLSEDLFPSAPPTDQTVQSYVEHLADTLLTVAEAAERASFTVLVPDRVHADACPSVRYSSPTLSFRDRVSLSYPLPGARSVHFDESSEEASYADPGEGWERVERAGEVVHISADRDDDTALTYVRLRRHGTAVSLGARLPREQVLDLAFSLRPLDPTRHPRT